MPYFDPRENRLHARVVYDGAVGAGKTANLRGLARLFAGPHDTEVHSPDEIGGHTLILDWMEIHAGVVAGLPLLCQIIGAPGHAALHERRRALLRTADVVVYVHASGTPVTETRRALAELRALRRADIPVVVQENHRDDHEPTSSVALARALGVDPRDVVEAAAFAGTGVVDTFVSAVRVLSRELSERSYGARLVPIGRHPGRAATVAAIAAIPASREGSAELYLRATNLELAAGARPAPLAKRAREPSLPDGAVATGFVWPADTGRKTLRDLLERGLDGQPRALPNDVYVYSAHDFVFETRVARRHTSDDAAKAALVAEARACALLEGLLVDGTVLAAKPARDGAVWVWTARPDISSLSAGLDPAVTERRSHLEAYGTALAHATRLAAQHGLELELRVDTFGLQRGTIRYVGPVRLGKGHKADLAAALASLDEDDSATVLAAFEREARRARAREEERAERTRDAHDFGAEAGTR